MPGVENLSARFSLTIFLLFFIGPFFVLDSFFPQWYVENEFFADSLMGVLAYAGPMAVLIYTVNRRGLFKGALPGQFPSPRLTAFFLSLAVPMVGISIVGITLFYGTLSIVAPEFVHSLFTEPTSPSLVFDSKVKNLIGSMLNVISLVVLAPVVEEILFRWLLVERWRHKYRTWVAVTMSSALFAILHFDLLGAFLFGLILSLVYIHTASLWGPILIHIGNNFIAFSPEVYDLIWPSNQEIQVNMTFDWFVVLGGCMLVVPWLPMAKRKLPLAVKLLKGNICNKVIC